MMWLGLYAIISLSFLGGYSCCGLFSVNRKDERNEKQHNDDQRAS